MGGREKSPPKPPELSSWKLRRTQDHGRSVASPATLLSKPAWTNLGLHQPRLPEICCIRRQGTELASEVSSGESNLELLGALHPYRVRGAS